MTKKYKIFLLGDLNSSHFVKWVSGLLSRGFKVYVFTFCRKNDMHIFPGADIYYGGSEHEFLNFEKEGSFRKIKLYKSLPRLFYLIRKIKPDIVHAHYASSYGLLGALLFYHPLLISTWGSDVFSFPGKSIIHHSMIKFVLWRADVVLSTSKILAEETSRYTNKKIEITPFGIDINKFRKLKVDPAAKEYGIVIGTVKKLEKIYGIDILIRVFAELKNRNKSEIMKLLIAGEGNLLDELKELADKLGIAEDVLFIGKVPYNKVEVTHNKISVFANLSIEESFGVAVLEASACEVPVVASDAGGLKEVVKNNITGYSVNIDNDTAIIKAFESLISSEELRIKMGKAGRQMVKEEFDWDKNLTGMINIYERTIKNRDSNTGCK